MKGAIKIFEQIFPKRDEPFFGEFHLANKQ